MKTAIWKFKLEKLDDEEEEEGHKWIYEENLDAIEMLKLKTIVAVVVVAADIVCLHENIVASSSLLGNLWWLWEIHVVLCYAKCTLIVYCLIVKYRYEIPFDMCWAE